MSYALVTGAAKGIGKGIARELARQGFDLLLIDKDEEALAATKKELGATSGALVSTLPLDISTVGALETITSWTAAWHHDLQVVVNNAGFGLNGSFEQLSLDEQLNMIDVNIKAQVSLSYAYIPVLKKQTRSFLLNVGSTTCFQTVPYLNVYAASKAFVVSFTRGLRFELQDSSLSVSVLIPGSTDTDFVNRAGMSEEVKKTAERFNMSPDLVGKIAVRGLFKGKAQIIPGFSNQLHGFFPRFFPKLFVEKIAGRIYKPAVPKEKFEDKIVLTR